MVKRRVRRAKKMRGRGVLDTANQVAKETKILSNVLGKVLGNDNFFARSAGTLGYGRKKRVVRKRRMRGRGIADVLGGIGTGIGKAGSGFLSALFGGARKRKGVGRMRGGFSTAVYRNPMNRNMIGSGANVLTN